jgi:hypothetical protein
MCMKISIGTLRRIIAECTLLTEINCSKCGDDNVYAEPNQPNGSFVCRQCRDIHGIKEQPPVINKTQSSVASGSSVKVYHINNENDAKKYSQGTKWPLPKYYNAYTKGGSRFVFVVMRSNKSAAKRFMGVIDKNGKELWFDETDNQVPPDQAFGNKYAEIKQQI